jgi:coproporphyrinogen III oxidase-like Fe-S oxidoreductase
MEAPKDDVAQEHFMILLDTLESNGFIHYELSILANKTFQKITPLIGWKKIYGYWTFGARLQWHF